MADDTGGLDDLITSLESAVDDAEELAFESGDGRPPRRCTFKVLSESFGSVSERRKNRQAELTRLYEGQGRIRMRDNIVAGHRLRVTIFFDKTGEGEILYRGDATISHSKRVPGCYEAILDFDDLQKTVQPVHRRFLECAVGGDFVTWNRWCSDLREGAVLRDLDLSDTTLVNFDLCAADLTGSDLSGANLANSNLSGANLTGCRLERARLAGADLFRVTIPRKYMGLLAAAGLVELDSVTLVD
ncbi:MAG: pentapeptide repeat-containing protein [Planctomycetota bacterium]